MKNIKQNMKLFNKCVNRISELENRGYEIENELKTLDVTKEFDKIKSLQKENVNNLEKAFKLSSKMNNLKKRNS